MSSLPTLPHRTWLERVSLVVEGALVICGLLTTLGWLFHADQLLQPIGNSTLKFNSALGILVVGTAMLAVDLGFRRAGWAGLIAAVLGGLTTAEHALGVDLRVDEFFVRDYLPSSGAPGRVALIGALSLLLSGVVIAWHAIGRFGRARLLTTAVVGSLVASAGFSTLVGYGAGLPAVYTWGSTTATSPITALALLLLGLALITLAWRESTKADGEAPAWSPMPVIIACLTLTLILWVGLVQRERTYIGANTVTAMDRFATSAEGEIERERNQFERMASRSANSTAAPRVLWEADALLQWTSARQTGCRVIEYLDRTGKTVWVYPVDDNEGTVGFDHRSVAERSEALAKAAQTKNATISRTTKVSTTRGAENGFVIYAPVTRDGDLIAYIAAEFAYQPLFDAIAVREQTRNQYQIEATIGSTLAYISGNPDSKLDRDLSTHRVYTVADRHVQISLTPLPTAIDRRFLPELALLAGFGITGLFGLSVHLARRAREVDTESEQPS